MNTRTPRTARRLLATIATATGVVLLASGCSVTGNAGTETGSGASTAAAGTVEDYVYAGTEADTATAEEAGLAAAEELGTADLPGDKTIGLILLSGQSPSSIRIQRATEEIADSLGWTVNVCDPNFDNQKLQQCATSLLAQNPSMIISASQNPTLLTSQIAEAKNRDIPWFGVLSGGAGADGFYDYGIDGYDLAKQIDSWMLERLATEDAARNTDILAFVAPTVGVANYNQQVQLGEDVDADGNATIAVSHDIDLTDVSQDILSTTSQTLEQNPELGAVWTVCDFCIPLISQSVTQAQGDDRHTLIVGSFSTPQSITGLRDGTVDAIAEYAWETQIWVAVDQALESWARGTDIAAGPEVYESYNTTLLEPYTLTAENVGTSGPSPILGPDVATYFSTKWNEEFGIS
ncbi:sugar ABC transporter substrate-binding protein [Herbiconiux sp. P15]|uniref:sugar ABC transporter substrate-binding protein n=1 Tax=Herbiconiux liukaitaii TaxID=3342799 RepID=UPI0035BB07BB